MAFLKNSFRLRSWEEIEAEQNKKDEEKKTTTSVVD